jgi:predicted nucleic acid-binding protein
MRAVVDASAVAAVVFEEADGVTIRAHLQHDTLMAPHLLDHELTNVALVKIRRGLGSEPLIRAMLSTVRLLHVRRMPVPADDVVALALRTGLSAYDAAYLWLAKTEDVELVTLDRKLTEADRMLRNDRA